jgi:hypothetical protein
MSLGEWESGNQTLVVPFADDRQVACKLIDMTDFDPHRFAQSKSAAIHHVQAVAIDGMLNSLDQPDAISVIKNIGQPTLT